jgi:methionyl-tRNA formyltransferase
MTVKRVAIVGDGKIAGDCIATVVNRSDVQMCATVFHRDNRWSGLSAQMPDSAQTIDCDNVNETNVVGKLRALSPDVIVNVNSFDILRDEILSIPSDGVVNFHNGPLPGYRGMNIPTWAIFNGEKDHGVTWHLVERAIDTGAILAQERFPIDSTETAISLTFKCIAAGLRQFEVLLQQYSDSGALIGVPQSGKSNYFRAADIPNDGFVDFAWAKPQLSRFVRSLSFRPFPEPRLRVRVEVDGKLIFAGHADVLDATDSPTPPGTVVAIENGAILVATKDSVLRLEDFSDGNDLSLAIDSIPLSPGQRLT